MLSEFLTAMALLGCGGAPMEGQLPIGRSRSQTIAIDTLGVAAIVRAPAARVWSALPVVLTELGLTINYREPAARRVGSCYQKVRARLGGAPLSDLVDCGETRSLPNADRYEVALTVITTVEITGPTSVKVHNYVLGIALDASGVASNRLWCLSKGVLEQRIIAAIERRLETGG